MTITLLVRRLGNGELALLGAEGPSQFYIEGGFVQVLDNTVSILANRVIEVKDLDAERCNRSSKMPAMYELDKT